MDGVYGGNAGIVYLANGDSAFVTRGGNAYGIYSPGGFFNYSSNTNISFL